MLDLERPAGLPLEEWLGMDDFRRWLLDSRAGEVPIFYFGGPHGGRLYLASALLRRRVVRQENLDELMNWQFNPVASRWGEVVYYRKGRKYRVIERRNNRNLASMAIPIIISRQNPFTKEREEYFEANPEITHIHDLHWLEEEQAYCTLDDLGDVRPIIKVKKSEESALVTIAADILYKHLILGKYVLARFFDLDRWAGEMPDHPDHQATQYWDEGEVFARWIPVMNSNGELGRAYLRGCQIIHPPANKSARQRLLEGEAKQYCTFVALDWKNRLIIETSCDPASLASYFVESPKPFETTPAFFRREVLRKYQDDADKYTVGDRGVTCRSSWSLPFDVNEAGQVHTYLIDLSHLPYQEQLYWKYFNEAPKGSISARSYKTDFLAEWDDQPEPLRDLKRLLENFPAASAPEGEVQVWQPPAGLDARLAEQVHYLSSRSRQEWEVEIVELDKLLVEGLNRKYLRRLVQSLIIPPETLGAELEEAGSLVLLRAILQAKGIATDMVEEVITPLRELHGLRSQFTAHRKGSDADKIAKELRRKHKSLPAHFQTLVAQSYAAMCLLSKLIERGYLTLPPA